MLSDEIIIPEDKPRRRERRYRERYKKRLGPRFSIQCLVFLFGACAIIGVKHFSPDQYFGDSIALDSPGRRLLATTTTAAADCSAPTPAAPHKSEYPEDIFTIEERRNGAILLHIFCLLYMFYGLAFVCDNYFESSLDAICKALDLSDDVAGATFMAAGSSAPELFTSIMGTFAAHNDVGVGTIVGSAVFNVLIIIGLCAIFAPGVQLTWWPLTRDSIFYCITIFALVSMLVDGKGVQLEESIACLVLYATYVLIMKYNRQINKIVQSWVDWDVGRVPAEWQKKLQKVTDSIPFQVAIAIVIVFNLCVIVLESVESRDWQGTANHIMNAIFIGEMALKMLGVGFYVYWQMPANAFDGILVALILVEYMLSGSGMTSGVRGVRVFRVFRASRGLRCVRLLLSTRKAVTTVKRKSVVDPNRRATKELAPVLPANGNVSSGGPKPIDTTGLPTETVVVKPKQESAKEDEAAADDEKDKLTKEGAPASDDAPEKEEGDGSGGDDDDDDDDDDEPYDLWEKPDSHSGWAFYIVGFPLQAMMYYTIPDHRRPRFAKYYLVTFGLSIGWIAIMSYLMVWMADIFGQTARIPTPVMGLTLLAAGTSIPDTIASVHVAMQGKGNMAVSNSIGSNVFDILIGLGFPWFLANVINHAKGDAGRQPDGTIYVPVGSESLTMSIMILFITVALVLLLIHFNHFKLERRIGYALLGAYGLFVLQALLFEFDIISLC